jgi:uncharacterized protein (DUF2267 family)
MLNKIPVIHRTNQKTNLVIKSLMESGLFVDENKAFCVLRAVMKSLRDRLTTEEAIQLGAQLPALLRGFYYEGWNLQSESKTRTKEGFLDDVRHHLNGHNELDILDVTSAALKVVLDMIDQGEAINVLHQLPKSIQELCPE